MSDDLRFDPDYRSHPGDTLGDIMIERDLDVPGLARLLEYPQPELNAVLAGDRPITADLARKLAWAMHGPSDDFWMNRQAQYDMFPAQKWGAIATEIRFCHFCHHMILEEDSPCESIKGGTWAHFNCWYDGEAFPPARYRKT